MIKFVDLIYKILKTQIKSTSKVLFIRFIGLFYDLIQIILVQAMRLELTQVTLYAPQTYASTNSAMPATKYIISKKMKISSINLTG